MERKQLRVCFDLDGVIAHGTVEDVYSDEAGWAYEHCEAIRSTIQTMHCLRRDGVEIYIHTARWEEDRPKTIDWLQKHNVPYDNISFGKPHADLYIDDKNYPVGFEPEMAGGVRGRHLGNILWHARRHSGKRR